MKDSYVLTPAIYHRIMGKRSEVPRCKFCGKTIDKLIGKRINRNVSRGKIRYYCDGNCNPDERRI